MNGARVLVVHSRPAVREALRAELEVLGSSIELTATMPTSRKAASVNVLILRWAKSLDLSPFVSNGLRPNVLALVEQRQQLKMAAQQADDFVLYPCDTLELRLRVERLIERPRLEVSPGNLHDGASTPVTIGSLQLDRSSGRVWNGQHELTLTRREYDLLSVLMSNAGRIISRDELLHLAWGERFPGKARTVDQHVAQLRDHLDDDMTNPRFIATRRGRGYVFLDQNAEPQS